MSCEQIKLDKASGPVLTLGSSMKLGLAVEISPSVFREQLTSWDRMSHAASADSLLLSTWREEKDNEVVTKKRATRRCFYVFFFKHACDYLEADVLQVISMPFDDLLDEVRVCGLQTRAGRLIQLKFEATPQLGHVEGLVPVLADLRRER